MKSKYFLKLNDYVGLPKLTDFKIIEEDIDDKLSEGGKFSVELLILF